MTDDYGIPVWGSYLIFAIATIILGLLIGLVCLTVCLMQYCHAVVLITLMFAYFVNLLLGHLLGDDLINPVKMSIHPYVHTSTIKHNAATNQIVVFVLRSMRHSRRYDF